MKNLLNETNNNTTFTSDHWFDREEVEPLRVGNKIRYFHHIMADIVTTIIKDINIKNRKKQHSLTLTKGDNYNQYLDGELTYNQILNSSICHSKIKFDNGSLIENPYCRFIDFDRYNIYLIKFLIVHKNDKQSKKLISTNFFIKFNESRKKDESEEESKEEYDKINYTIYIDPRVYYTKTKEEKEATLEQNARKK